MSSINLKAPTLNFTPIDNNFIDIHLRNAHGDFVKVYIYMLRKAYSGLGFSIEEASDTLGLTQSDVIKALEYWEETGITSGLADGDIRFSTIQPDSSQSKVYYDKGMKEMLDGVERLVGRLLSPKELQTYLDFAASYEFTPELIVLLVEYCTSKMKTDIRYIEKVALAWNEAGIRTLQDAQNYITKHEDKWKQYRAILGYMGIKDGDIAKPQEEAMERWLYKYGFSLDVIQEACKICILKLNESNFNYIEAILSNWNKSGYKTLADIKGHSKKPKTDKKAPVNRTANNSNKRQYDMEKLEKLLLGRSDNNAE